MENKLSPVQAILISNNCDTSLVEPPKEYATTSNPFLPTDSIQSFDVDPILSAAGSAQSDAEKYMHARHYYLTQFKNQQRDQKSDPEFEKIRSTVERMDIDDVMDLFAKRHSWIESESEYRGDVRKVCCDSHCVNEAVPGSDFCIQHLDSDKEQKLFCKCSDCGRMHPVTTTCYYCSEK